MNTDGHRLKTKNLLSSYLCASVFICGSILLSGGCTLNKPTVAKKPPATQPMSMDRAMRLIDDRPGWTDFPRIDVPRHPAEKFLKDVTIVIDPGHGGEDG